MRLRTVCIGLILVWLGAAASVRAIEIPGSATPATKWARQVTIHRDQYGVPHVFGTTDESVIFGFAYVQAEDFFWQVEDSYILALGRYAEFHGPRGLNSDLLNRAFQIAERSRKDFPRLDARARSLCTAYATGLNHYLARHPEVRPRLITQFEPWHVLAFHRHIALELCFRYTHLSSSMLPRGNDRIWAARGSNAWAISGKRTKSGNAMLFVNPHLPYYGFAQLYEAHLSGADGPEGERWNFTGATFLGSPVLTIGHNQYLGWTMTVNEPDIADVWRIKPLAAKPDSYQYGDYERTFEKWRDTINIRSGGKLRQEVYTFRNSSHGPIVGKDKDGSFLAARISGLFEAVPMRQAMAMMKARTLGEFRAALALLQMPFMNVIYADVEGNIFYLYGARVPRRDAQFEWAEPVDGNNPQTEWLGIHGIDELPQVLNPACGFVQNCNSSPMITSDDSNPVLADFPSYMMEDHNAFKRRALRSLEVLREREDLTLDDLEDIAFDTTSYWAIHEMPKLLAAWDSLEAGEQPLKKEIAPYVKLLQGWDGKITLPSTAATLATTWYEILYGSGYPGETMRGYYRDQPVRQLEALSQAANQLHRLHSRWEVPYGDLFRLQRRALVGDIFALRFNDRGRSLPTAGGHGPMGVIFTQYYTPSLYVPLFLSQKKRYAVLGASYLAIYEFAKDGIRGRSVVPYGASGNFRSPHYLDQAELFSQERLKPILFTRDAVIQEATRSYHPGD